MTMMLFPKAYRKRLADNGKLDFQAVAYGDGDTSDHAPVVKLFTPDGQATWLLTALEFVMSDDGKEIVETGRAFGLCDLGMGFPELGYVDIEELKAIRGGMGLPVERDMYFTADKPLSEYAKKASEEGRITA